MNHRHQPCHQLHTNCELKSLLFKIFFIFHLLFAAQPYKPIYKLVRSILMYGKSFPGQASLVSGNEFYTILKYLTNPPQCSTVFLSIPQCSTVWGKEFHKVLKYCDHSTTPRASVHIIGIQVHWYKWFRIWGRKKTSLKFKVGRLIRLSIMLFTGVLQLFLEMFVCF